MNPVTASTKELLYAGHKFENCDGFCDRCPCFNEDYSCSEVYEIIKDELNSRKERVQYENLLYL